MGTSKNQNAHLQIYDASGRLVKSVKLETTSCQLGADLVPGVYFLKLTIGEHKKIQKLIKIR
ncbi:T9SS type A sorting domain-containing protein [candidate division WOR-3 bacterium]|nr:T9SS type A sorting domain-containing protein [candidate division WOR-3 bacterium]